MKLIPVLLLTASLASGQTIATRALNPSAPTKINVNPAITTTLLCPAVPAGVFGLGLVSKEQTNGSVQIEHPDGSNILVFHALSETAHVLATILLDGCLYVLDLQSSTNPDVAVTLTKGQAVPGAVETTVETVKAQRIKYDPELLHGFLSKVHNARLMRAAYPELYKGYASRPANYTSDSGLIKTTVQQIHRFSAEDAIVLQGTVQNLTDKPANFDGRAATVEVANSIYPVKLLDVWRPIAPNQTVQFEAVIQGDIDGGRSNISIDNEYRLILPSPDGMSTLWDYKSGKPTGKFKVTAPVTPETQAIPLTQTGTVIKEKR